MTINNALYMLVLGMGGWAAIAMFSKAMMWMNLKIAVLRIDRESVKFKEQVLDALIERAKEAAKEETEKPGGLH